MKVLSKPLSSPSRTDKFPPPLMRFLRTNVGSRSRGRSRSSPMFYLRSRRSAPALIQEPSSPKVTCIGQVRVRRSAKSKPRTTSIKRRRRWWLKRATCFGKITSPNFLRRCKNPFAGMFCKCGSLFGWGDYCRRKVDSRDSSRISSNSRGAKSDNNIDCVGNGHCSSNESEPDYANRCENLGAGSLKNQRGCLESSSSPPKNALMLTRCRSAPYRSSSLGGRFWGSPLAKKDEDNNTENDDVSAELPGSSSINVEEEENEEGRAENGCKEMVNTAENVEEIKKMGAVHPLLLTRCKSEPARAGERLSEEAILLRQTRLAGDDSQQNP